MTGAATRLPSSFSSPCCVALLNQWTTHAWTDWWTECFVPWGMPAMVCALRWQVKSSPGQRRGDCVIVWRIIERRADGTVGETRFGLFFRVKETHQLGQLGFVQEHIEMDKWLASWLIEIQWLFGSCLCSFDRCGDVSHACIARYKVKWSHGCRIKMWRMDPLRYGAVWMPDMKLDSARVGKLA